MRSAVYVVALLLSSCVAQLLVDTPDDWPPFAATTDEGPWVDDEVSVELSDSVTQHKPLCFTDIRGQYICISGPALCDTDGDCAEKFGGDGGPEPRSEVRL